MNYIDLLSPKLLKRDIKLGIAYIALKKGGQTPTKEKLLSITGMTLGDSEYNASVRALSRCGVVGEKINAR